MTTHAESINSDLHASIETGIARVLSISLINFGRLLSLMFGRVRYAYKHTWISSSYVERLILYLIGRNGMIEDGGRGGGVIYLE